MLLLDPQISEEVKDKLRSDEANSFVDAFRSSSYAVYKRVVQKAGLHKSICDFELNPVLLTTAIQSAYLDIQSSTEIHIIKNGPSPEKKAAAITSWVNLFKPIQVTNPARYDRLLLALNPRLAYTVGITYLAMERGFDQKLIGAEKIHDILYALTWRRPSYRELTLLYQVISPAED